MSFWRRRVVREPKSKRQSPGALSRPGCATTRPTSRCAPPASMWRRNARPPARYHGERREGWCRWSHSELYFTNAAWFIERLTNKGRQVLWDDDGPAGYQEICSAAFHQPSTGLARVAAICAVAASVYQPPRHTLASL